MEGNKELYYEYQKNYHKKIREIKQRVANGQKIRNHKKRGSEGAGAPAEKTVEDIAL